MRKPSEKKRKQKIREVLPDLLRDELNITDNEELDYLVERFIDHTFITYVKTIHGDYKWRTTAKWLSTNRPALYDLTSQFLWEREHPDSTDCEDCFDGFYKKSRPDYTKCFDGKWETRDNPVAPPTFEGWRQ